MRIRATAVLATLTLLLAGACSPGASGRLPTPGSSFAGGASGLGTVRTIGPASVCQPDSTCTELEVGCAGLPPARAIIAERAAEGSPRGVLMYFSGGHGIGWWGGKEAWAAYTASMSGDGFVQAEVRWVDSWLVSGGGREGPARLACRPATLIAWGHANLYVPLGLAARPNACGFCVTGNSAGASQVAYALSTYGLAAVVGIAVPTSGPPHADIAAGCLTPNGPVHYVDWASRVIDESYGYGSGGPCARGDPAQRDRWVADSVDAPRAELAYPDTCVIVILGSDDHTPAPAHARAYVAALRRAGSPRVELRVLPGEPHQMTFSAGALAAIRAALLGGCA